MQTFVAIGNVIILNGIKNMRKGICDAKRCFALDKFEKIVTDRVVNELNKRGIKQVQLIDLCESAGMKISQPDISKIYSGKKTLNLHQFAVICKVLKMPMESFTWLGEDGGREDFCNPNNSKTLHDTGNELKCYVGKYYFYYLSTASGEDKILKGELFVREKEEYYTLKLCLDTGVSDRQGEEIFKEYAGRIIVSSSLGAAYLMLKSELIGEICMVCIRHRRYSIKDMECRVGLALTMSAGEEKIPTVHRCLLLRDDIAGEQLEDLRPWMNLIHADISIEKDRLISVLEEEEKKYPQYTRQLNSLKEASVSKEIIELSVDNIRRQLPMKRTELMGFLSLLHRNSRSVKNYKVSQSDDIRFYEEMESLKESVRAEVPGVRSG